MLKKVLQYFAGQHYFTLIITIIVIVLGSYALTKINKDKDPRIDFGQMEITTIYPGASPEDVELKVTNKIETQLEGISGLKNYYSVSSENISNITVYIDENVRDQKKVKDEIRRAVDRVNDFPAEVDNRPIITDINTSVFPIIDVGLTGDLPYAKLREVARILKKKLEKIEGVSSLDPLSYMAREVKVKVSPEKIKNFNISLDEIFMAIKNENIRSAGGHVGNVGQEKNIITTSQFKSPMEVGDVIVRSSIEGFSIRVKDLSKIEDDFKDFDVISRMEGKPAITFTVYKNENADVVKTVDQIRELIQAEQKYLPEGLKLTLTNDVSKMVTNRFNIVRDNGIVGLILCFLVLTLVLDFRTSFWVGLGIPFALF
ncbi:MAG: efflux RND transporter permease subunit, partial [Bacteriovoracales bacterium]